MNGMDEAMTQQEAERIRAEVWALRDHKRRSADLRYGGTPKADRLQEREIELCKRLAAAGYSLCGTSPHN